MYRYIFFDLDGTLTDSKEGVVNCVRYAAQKLGGPQQIGRASCRERV